MVRKSMHLHIIIHHGVCVWGEGLYSKKIIGKIPDNRGASIDVVATATEIRNRKE